MRRETITRHKFTMRLLVVQLAILMNLTEAFLVDQHKTNQDSTSRLSGSNLDVQQLTDYVEDMKHVLNSAVTKIGTLTDENNSLKALVGKLQTRVQNLENASNQQHTNNSGLQQKVDQLTTRVDSVERKHSELGSELGSELQNNSAVVETVRQLQDDVGTHELKIAEILTQSSSLKLSIQSVSSRLQNQTSELRQKLEDFRSNETERLSVTETQLSYIADQFIRVDKGVQSLNTSVRHLQRIHDTGDYVAFLLQFQDNWVEHYREGTDMKFDNVLLDTAQGYNSTSGVYRCPRAGLYLLSIRCSTDWLTGGRSITYASVYRNGQVLVSATADEDTHAEDDYVQIPAVLEEGDVISMRQDFVNTTQFAGGAWTFFSGVLLQPKLSN